MVKDNVECTNCGFKGQVFLGEEICSECGECACLAWIDGEPQEIED